MTLKRFKEHRASVILGVVVLALTVSLFIAPVLSISNNPCSSCHGQTFSQYLDVLEEDNQTIIPASINVGQTLTVSVAIQNTNNALLFTDLTNLTVTLKSLNNHFSAKLENYTIKTMHVGITVATWQITGTSPGSDQFLITASGINLHRNIVFLDSYSPNPTITVNAATGSTIAIPTQSMPNYTSTLAPTPVPTVSPTASSNRISQPSELSSDLVYVHPPLAIAGFVFIFLFTALVFKSDFFGKRTKLFGLTAWILTLAGLLTGMFWAQVAWGSYWSWDIKETLTLILFLTLTVGEITYFERRKKATCLLLIASCVLVVATAATSILIVGVHSFL